MTAVEKSGQSGPPTLHIHPHPASALRAPVHHTQSGRRNKGATSEPGSEDNETSSLSPPGSSSYEEEFGSMFPPVQRIMHHPLPGILPFCFAYQTELQFYDDHYQACWNSQAIDLTGRLVAFEPQNPITIGHPEREFAGIRVRLILDSNKTAGLSPFVRGTVVDFENVNTSQHKYIVECCQHESGGFAYLKVVCHLENQWVFPADDPDHPMFILVIPRYLNAAPTFSNLNPQSAIHSTHFSCSDYVRITQGFLIAVCLFFLGRLGQHIGSG